MYPDIDQGSIDDKNIREMINDDSWIENTFMPTVCKRGR